MTTAAHPAEQPATITPDAKTPLAPGSIIEVRDEEWLVTGVQTVYERATHQELTPSKPVNRIEVQGLSELVRDTSAIFYDSIDRVIPLDPRRAPLISDDSPGYRNSRLWLEATLMKTAVPVEDTRIRLADGMLIDAKDYQRTPVRKILDPDNLRPRILLADAVGLGKTIEIGLILAELIKRGRGDCILIVTPKHVLEQMQHEMWTKFAISFVRLDSQGIQRIRQTLPATRNPFTYFKRAIISIDTLKSDRYRSHLRKHQWDAVVIDESHNVTNTSSLNNRLATTLARNTDAFILASATPHNGKKESFAELIRLLEPTAVRPNGDLDAEAVAKLVVRRHRYSDDVRKEVGADWAERKAPQALTAQASPQENAVADELDQVWLHPTATAENPSAKSPYSGNTQLFPWTLAKAFLSSPEALLETVDNRLRSITDGHPNGVPNEQATAREFRALTRLHTLAKNAQDAVAQARAAKQPQLGKYGKLLEYLKYINVGPKRDNRVVVFAERIATLNALAVNTKADLKFKDDQVQILHGGLNDQDQQAIVESFKKKSSPIRVLVTGDVASEGVNLHSQCHELVHFDIPWSLIRIEQRNGRIDRYGQTHSPQITTLVLEPGAASFSGDIHVLVKLIEKENEAHKALGAAAALMGKYSAKAEEDAVRDAPAKGQDLDQVIPDAAAVAPAKTLDLLGVFARPASPGGEYVVGEAAPPSAASSLSNQAGAANPGTASASASAAQAGAITPAATGLAVYSAPVQFLEDGRNMVFHDHPDQKPSGDGQGGVGWKDYTPGVENETDSVFLTFPRPEAERFASVATAHIDEVKLSNDAMQQVLQRLLLNKYSKKRQRGFITYANLGINQPGRVYEGLMPNTAIFAENDLLEVAPHGDPPMGTWAVSTDRVNEQGEDEGTRIKAKDFVRANCAINGEIERVIRRVGTFVFRLSRRDCQQSASYYTPEVFTKLTVRQALAELLTEVAKADHIIRMTGCETCQPEWTQISGGFALAA